MEELIETLERMKPLERLAYVKENPHVLEGRTEAELNRIGSLLCAASSEEMRESAPILGDGKKTKQQQFETEIFGDGERKPGSFVPLKIIEREASS